MPHQLNKASVMREFHMPLPRWLARFNSQFTNYLLSPLAELLPGMGVVVHTGRKTRRPYRTPVLVFGRGDRFIIALTYGRESQWVRNVLAQGGCELQTQGHTLRLSHPHLFHDEQRRVVPAFHRVILKLVKVSDFLELTSVD
jgi:deazaflavin-dependent oxidoreductase (nitroreductase family)